MRLYAVLLLACDPVAHAFTAHAPCAWRSHRCAAVATLRHSAVLSSQQPQETQSPLPRWQAIAALNACTLIWGSQHAIIKGVLDSAPPSAVNAARFGIAALFTLPFLPLGDEQIRPDRESNSRTPGRAVGSEPCERLGPTWAAGAELGAWSFLGFALQAIGLQTTTASRSAFLLYLNVKLVPLLALLLYGRQTSLRTWVSAAIALCGTALLCSDGSPPNVGDAWSVAAALASACFILRLEEASRMTRASELNAVTIVCSAVYCTLWAAGELALPGGGGFERAQELVATLSEEVLPLGYLAVVTTAVAQWLQALGQTRVGAQEASLIYALDPVYAAGFSFLLLGEQLGAQGIAGATVVLAGVLVSQSGDDGDGGSGKQNDDAPVSVDGSVAAASGARTR